MDFKTEFLLELSRSAEDNTRRGIWIQWIFILLSYDQLEPR